MHLFFCKGMFYTYTTSLAFLNIRCFFLVSHVQFLTRDKMPGCQVLQCTFWLESNSRIKRIVESWQLASHKSNISICSLFIRATFCTFFRVNRYLLLLANVLYINLPLALLSTNAALKWRFYWFYFFIFLDILLSSESGFDEYSHCLSKMLKVCFSVIT
jgi:hypothetical protein